MQGQGHFPDHQASVWADVGEGRDFQNSGGFWEGAGREAERKGMKVAEGCVPGLVEQPIAGQGQVTWARGGDSAEDALRLREGDPFEKVGAEEQIDGREAGVEHVDATESEAGGSRRHAIGRDDGTARVAADIFDREGAVANESGGGFANAANAEPFNGRGQGGKQACAGPSGILRGEHGFVGMAEQPSVGDRGQGGEGIQPGTPGAGSLGGRAWFGRFAPRAQIAPLQHAAGLGEVHSFDGRVVFSELVVGGAEGGVGADIEDVVVVVGGKAAVSVQNEVEESPDKIRFRAGGENLIQDADGFFRFAVADGFGRHGAAFFRGQHEFGEEADIFAGRWQERIHGDERRCAHLPIHAAEVEDDEPSEDVDHHGGMRAAAEGFPNVGIGRATEVEGGGAGPKADVEVGGVAAHGFDGGVVEIVFIVLQPVIGVPWKENKMDDAGNHVFGEIPGLAARDTPSLKADGTLAVRADSNKHIVFDFGTSI